MVAQVEEPFSFQEAVQHQVWVDAMAEEYSSIMMNDVWAVLLGSGSGSGERERKRERERPFSEAPGLGANPGAIF